ncbi:class I SAM-dependent methyltransferase [Erysipelothrix urinaevulpis]|uniref:class I SAM-dependent methyltransferase n=1 Tax=Erysipelothrix urinaevulpis TaxID=2683717 RepID=UPI00135C76CB|nr:methyltransferase [Erysipelothrix urinaevulpis]
MSHYFTDNRELVENRREITFRFFDYEYILETDNGVFSKEHVDLGTQSLLKACLKEDMNGSEICDLGCGYGVVGVVLSKEFKDVTVTGFDINPRAVDLANLNFKKNSGCGENFVHDGIKGKFDWVITNPPIRVGKEKMYSLFDEAYDSLRSGGGFMFVIRKQHGAKSAQKKCIDLFGNCELLTKEKGFYTYIARKH